MRMTSRTFTTERQSPPRRSLQDRTASSEGLQARRPVSSGLLPINVTPARGRPYASCSFVVIRVLRGFQERDDRFRERGDGVRRGLDDDLQRGFAGGVGGD